jgi:Tfp pilus assembly protein PilZ
MSFHGRERRRHPRVATDVVVCFHVGAFSQNLTACGRIRNMSDAGVFVETENLPPMGETVTMEFASQSGAVLRLQGRVIWTGHVHETPGMGIEFSATPPSSVVGIV